MARKKSTAELVAAVQNGSKAEGGTGSKRGRKKGSKNRKASACEINTKDADKAIATVGNLIRGIEKAVGVKFGRPQVMKLGSPGGGFARAKKGRRRKAA